MTGGWGTPKANPQRVRLPGHPPYDVLTGRCADGLHDDCHGHLLGVPCCCDCHTTTEENTDEH